jgi:hypothetical protein
MDSHGGSSPESMEKAQKILTKSWFCSAKAISLSTAVPGQTAGA